MASLRNKKIRAYTRSELSDEIKSSIPEGFILDYAHPRYFKNPVVTVDYVYVQEDRDSHIIDVYADKGIPVWGQEEPTEVVEEEEESTNTVIPTEPENVSDEATDNSESKVEEDSKEGNTDQESQLEGGESESFDPTKLGFFELKAYVKQEFGKSPKTKKEAYQILGINPE